MNSFAITNCPLQMWKHLVSRQNLQRDSAAKLDILSETDFAHAAFAEGRKNFVVTDLSADC